MADWQQRFTYLAEILVNLAGSPVPGQQFQVIADYAHFVLPHDYLALALLNPDKNGYLVHSLKGSVAGALTPRLFAPDEGLVGQVLTRNKVLVTADFTADDMPQTAELEGIMARFGLRAALIVPVRQGMEPIGALLFLAKPPVAYQEDDVQLATLLAAGLSSSLEVARMYQVLADEHSTLLAVLASTHDAVLVVNEQGTILLANPAVRGMLELDSNTLVGQSLTSVGVAAQIVGLFRQTSVEKEEVRLPNGRVAEASVVLVRSPYGEEIGWAAVFHDITLFKQLGQMKNEFVNTVSHDLKNPISIIRIATDLLTRVGDLNEQQIDLRQRVLKTTDYMTELVSDLLDLGRIEAGIDQEKELFDLATLIHHVVFDLRPNWEEKEQEMNLMLPEKVMITADKGQFRQVLLNLIGNAIKYTPKKRDISVIVTADEKKVILQVKDQGIGIPASDMPHIFDKFYRVSNDQTKDIKGTGLGLAITKGIIEAHNGRISVTSAPNEGSVFIVTLPQ